MRQFDRNSVRVAREHDPIPGIFSRLMESVNSPVSLACWMMYKYGEFEQLARKRIHPAWYCQATRFRDDYLSVSYLSKFKGLETGLDVKTNALSLFSEAEAVCRQTNARFRSGNPGNPRVEPALWLATRKIAAILGELKVETVYRAARWSGGATATLRAADANIVRKMDESPISVTRGALDHLRKVIEDDPHWLAGICKNDVDGPVTLLDSVFRVVEWNRVTTVPKDATKDRTIAAEPTGNVFLQLGVGSVLRSKLKKRAGIDLDSQEANRNAALEGSRTGALVTVDLKSASDTVSRQLVLQLLPWDWFELLDQLRCREGKVGNELLTYEKFSSMGNGYTFELETLIFYSLAWACAQLDDPEGTTLVYGDDIVTTPKAYPRLLEVLSWCGFSVNTEKTHAVGYFRESCGGHYWGGLDVTPIYQKERLWINGQIIRPEVYRCANRLIRLAYRRGHRRWLDADIKSAWRHARGAVKPLHAIPLDTIDDVDLDQVGVGDDGLALPLSELGEWQIGKARHGLLTLPVLSFVGGRREVPPMYHRTLLSYWLRFVPDEPFAGVVADGRKGYYVSRRRTYPVGTPDVAWV
jgi:hypothetical protein